MIRLSLNQNSCKAQNLIEFIKYSRNFDGVELNFKRIKEYLSENKHIKEILELLEIYDTKLTSIFKLKNFSLCSDREYKTKVLTTLKQMIRYSYKLEGNLLILNPSLIEASQGTNLIPQWRILNKTRKRLEEIAKVAKNEDIRIGFEFINMPNSSIRTLSEAKQVIAPLESIENIGYIIDIFHFIKSKSQLNELKDIKELIFLIQLSDFKFKTQEDISNLEDLDRVFPGEGDFEYKKFINFAWNIGYRKNYSIELLKNNCSENFSKKKFLRNFKNIKL